MKKSRSPDWEEDYNFLLAQRLTPQQGFMGRFDRKNADRANKTLERKEKRASSKKLVPTSLLSIDCEENEDEEESELLISYDECEVRNRTPRPSSVPLLLPTKTISKITGQIADSRNLSVRDHLKIT